MSPSIPKFILRPLSQSDIEPCAHIAGQAFASDRQTQFKAANPTNPYNHVEGMKAALRHWLDSPPGTTELTVAIDDFTQQIIGWVVWSFRGFDLESNSQTKLLNMEAVREDAPAPDSALLNDRTISSRDRLEQHTSGDLQEFMKVGMPSGSKCMYVSSIVVHPSHQGRGVGTALVRKGTDGADAEGVCAWVHSSEAGAAMFGKCGFEEIRRLVLDLDEWDGEGIVAPEGRGARWGKYVLRYMLRQPVANS